MSPACHVHVRTPGKALISWEHHGIEKRTHRLRLIIIRETPFMKKYGNTNSFIIIFGSGHFSGREVRGNSLSVTIHCIPRNATAMFSQLHIKRVCDQYFNHFQASEGKWRKNKWI